MNRSITLQKFYEITKIPMQLFNETELIQSIGFDHSNNLPFNKLFDCLLEQNHQVSYTISQENIIYGLIKIPHSTEQIAVGPVMSYKCTLKHAEDILQSLELPLSRASLLMDWFKSIPLTDLDHFRQILHFITYILTEDDSLQAIFVDYTNTDFQNTILTIDPYFIDNSSDLLEKQLLSYIETGNINAMEAALKNLYYDSDAVFPKQNSNALRFYKNIFILSTSLASRAALKGGLEYNLINTLTGSYLSQIEKNDSFDDIFSCIRQMFLDFTKRVSYIQFKQTESLIVLKIYKDVQVHLYEKNSPSLIAKRLNMNNSYICRHFKQETNKTITEYINETKINESIRMLATTDLSLIQIAIQLGFSSQSYFHIVFKKVTGITPIEYKEKINFHK